MKKLHFNKQDIIIASSFLFICIYVLFYGYVGYERITLDSIKYLRSAQSILDGNWLFYNASAGDTEYFRGAFPPGTALLIASISFLTSTDVYVASVILSIVSVLITILILRANFPAKTWILVLTLFSLSFLKISSFVWSERFFLVGLLWFGISLSKIIEDDIPGYSKYLSLLFASLFSFFIRFIGVFLVGTIGLSFLYFLIKYYKSKDKNFRKKALSLILVAITCTLLIGGYLIYNKTMTGYFTGVARVPAPETIYENTLSFLRAAKVELQSFFVLWLDEHVISAVLITLFLAIIFYFKKIINYFKGAFKENSNKHKLHATVIFITGILYFCTLLLLRFSSQFDSFNYRLLYCGTFLITLSIVLLALAENLLERINSSMRLRKCILLSIFIILSMVLRIDMEKLININEPYYKYKKTEVLNYYNEVAPQSLVVGVNDTKLNVGFLRTDIVTIDPQNFFNDYSNGSYDMYENIYLDKSIISEFIVNIENIDEVNFYNENLASDADFIKIN